MNMSALVAARDSRYIITRWISIRPKKTKLIVRNVGLKIHNGYIPLSEPVLVVQLLVTPVTFHPAEDKYQGIYAFGRKYAW
jgi:hypothetical protein